MDKLKMHSPDLTQDNIAKIRDMFPGCVTEARDEVSGKLRLAVDFDQLRQELSESIVEGPQERYRLDWPGKREAQVTTNLPVAKTLRPIGAESVEFGSTRNLFIEGDNLEALKLLQETYLGKIKMIYIDPPYNTGNDFVYDDDFAESVEKFLAKSNQTDSSGNRLVTNTESNGRFHSDWLSMMYPRLKLARNLLRADGVIFISIDDGEHAALKKLCDDVFGEDNFIANIIWQKKFAPQNDAKFLSESHDHVLLYARQSSAYKVGMLPRTEEADDRYKNPDNDPRGRWASGDLTRAEYRPRDFYPVVSPKTGKEFYPPEGNSWRRPPDVMQSLIDDARVWFGEDGNNFPRMKRYLSDVKQGITPQTIWERKDVGDTQEGKKLITKYFGNASIFETPKPPRLIERMMTVAGVDHEDVVLDFFAGSGSTMEACFNFQKNVSVLLVQMPEPTLQGSEPAKAGFSTIAEICKERVRRAGQRILEGECHPDWNRDVGFRVLKVDTSNMKDVHYRPGELRQGDLLSMVDSVKEDRTAEDLLFQVLVDWGVDLTLPIRRETVQGKTVFFVDENALVACFDKGVSEDLVKELVKQEPLRVVFRDSGFASDAVKINVEQIFRQLSPTTEVKSI